MCVYVQVWWVGVKKVVSSQHFQEQHWQGILIDIDFPNMYMDLGIHGITQGIRIQEASLNRVVGAWQQMRWGRDGENLLAIPLSLCSFPCPHLGLPCIPIKIPTLSISVNVSSTMLVSKLTIP